MGGRRNLNIQNNFERRLGEAIASSQHVFLFDQISLQSEVGEYFSTYYQICENSGRDLFELEGSNVSEQSLAQILDIKKTREEAKEMEKNGPVHSPFRTLCNLIETRESGIICIHNAHQLSASGLDVLSRLAGHVRRMKLHWQFVIFADTVRINNLSSLKPSIDQAYPEHILHGLEKDDVATTANNTSRTRKRVKKPSIWEAHGLKILGLFGTASMALFALRYL